MKKIMLGIIALIPIVLIFTIQFTSVVLESTTYIAVEKVMFMTDEMTIKKTDSNDVQLEFPATVLPVAATDKSLIYESNDEDIAVVDQFGNITFKKFGLVKISAKSKVANLINDECEFFVTDDKIHEVHILNKTVGITKGESYKLETKVVPAEAIDKNLFFESSDETVATVAPDGTITAVEGGFTTITVKSLNGKEDSFTMQVVVPVEKIEIVGSNKLTTGQSSAQFPSIVFTPHNSTNKNVVYSSSDISVATISSTGEILFSKAGEVTFKARSADGGYSTEYKVEYTGGLVKGAEIVNASMALNYNFSDMKNLVIPIEIKVAPADAVMTNVWLESSNETAVKIINNEAIVVGGGRATITMKANSVDGSIITSSREVFIARPATEIVVNNAPTATINTREFVLDYTVLTSDHTDTITFYADSNIASVTSNGVVNFNAPGEAEITITANENVKKNVVIKYIPNGATEIHIDRNNQDVEINLNQPVVFTFAKALNMGSATFAVSGTSANGNAVLNYDNLNKVITAINGGNAVITATGNKTININVQAIRDVSGIDYVVSGVNVNNGQIITALKEFSITSSTLPVDATVKVVDIEVDNTQIVQVSGNTIKFLQAGTIVVKLKALKNPNTQEVVTSFITATSTYGELTNVEIVDNLSTYVCEYVLNEEINFVVNVLPVDGSFEKVIFETSDANVVKVENNKLYVVGGGECIITARNNAGTSTSTRKVFVNRKATEINLNGITTDAIEITDIEYIISYTTMPSDNTDAVTYEIESDVASIATHSRANGLLTVVFDAPGEAILTIIANESVKKQLNITYIPSGAESYVISQNNQTLEVDYGKNFVLIFDDSLSMGGVTYTVSGTSVTGDAVLELDTSTMVFSTKSGGDAVITSTGNSIININVKVTRNVTKVEYELTGVTLSNGGVVTALTEFSISANTYPIDATNKNVEIVSSDSSIAEVNSGTIEFLKAGTVVFTVRALKRPGSSDYVSTTFNITSTFGCIETITLESTQKYVDTYQENKEIVFNFSIYPADADKNLVLLTSTNSNVVKVENNRLYIVGGGSSVIQLSATKADGQVASATREIYINRPATDIIVGNIPTNTITTTEYTIEYSVLTADHTDTITLSADSSIASVDNNGVVSFNTPGEVKITITANQNVKKEVVIKYIPAGASEIQITENNQNVEIDVNDEVVFTFAKALNMGSTTFAVSGISANGGDVLNYNSLNKIITGVNGGTGTVSAVGNSTLTFKVNVIKNVSSIDYSLSGVSIADGQVVTSKEEFSITSSTMPVDATVRTVEITSSDTSTAVINGSKVQFLKAGTVTITMSALVNPNSTNTITTSFSVFSSFGLPTNFDVTNKVIIADVGLSTQVNFGTVFAPSDYQLERSDFNFSSDDTNIASISAEGVITGNSWGTTTIYVSVNSPVGIITKTIEVEVQEKSDSVDLTYNGKVLNGAYIISDTIQLGSKILPTTTNNQEVRYYIVEIVDGEADDAVINQSTGLLTFYNNVTARVAVETLDNGTTKIVSIRKVAGPDELQVYYGESLVTGLIKIEANGANPVVKIKPEMTANSNFPDGIIDMNLADIEYDVVDESGLSTTLTASTSGGYRYFTIVPNRTIVKSLTTSITFRYGSVTYTISIKFFALQGISLVLDNKDDADYGLEQRRVFGSYSHTDGKWESRLNIEYSNTPEDVQDQLYWFVKASDSEWAYFESSTSGVFRLNSSKINAALTEMTTYEEGYAYPILKITIFVGNESDYTLYDNLLTTPSADPTFKWDYYTYTIVNGCNIFDGDDFDYAWQNYQRMVLHANIGTEEDRVEGQNFGVMSDATKNAHRHMIDVYGNGYTLNFEGHLGNTSSVNEINIAGIGRNIITNVNYKGQNVDTTKKTYTRSLTIGGGRMQYCTAQGFDVLYVSQIPNDQVGTWYEITEFYRCIFRHFSHCGLQLDGLNRKQYVEDCMFYDVAQCAIDFQDGELYIKGDLKIYNYVTYKEYDTSYQSFIKKAFNSSEFANYVDKSGSETMANVGVCIADFKTPAVDTVYFWNPTTSAYVANSDNCTGYNYTKVTKTQNLIITKIYLHMWLMPMNGSKVIKPTDIPNVAELRRI